MKRCPSCSQIYSDNEAYCRTDGARLADAGAASVRDETITGKTLSIKLDGPADYYLPGDTVHGTVTVSTEKEIKINKIFAGLGCSRIYRVLRYSDEYKLDGANPTYETRHEVAEAPAVHTFAQGGEIPALTASSYEFHFTIPEDAAPTCVADLVELRWVIMAKADIPWAYDLTQHLELTVASKAPGKRLEPGVYGEMVGPEGSGDSMMSPLGLSRRPRGNEFGLKMRLRLPMLEFLAGESFEGSLLIDLQEDLECAGLYVSLVRSECTLDGNVPYYSRKSTQVVSLEPAAVFEGGGADTRIPFLPDDPGRCFSHAIRLARVR